MGVVPNLDQGFLSSSDIHATTERQDVRVVIADDNVLFRGSLRALFRASFKCDVVADSGDPKTTLQLVREHSPDILLLGWRMSQQDDMKILRELASDQCSVRTVLIGFEEDNTALVNAIRLGIRAILSCETSCDELFEIFGKVMEGQYVFGQTAVHSLVHHATSPMPRSAFQKARQKFGITRREFELISEVVAGFSTSEIAERLSLSPNTLKHHMTHIYDKLGLSNRLELVLFAVHHGITSNAL